MKHSSSEPKCELLRQYMQEGIGNIFYCKGGQRSSSKEEKNHQFLSGDGEF